MDMKQFDIFSEGARYALPVGALVLPEHATYFRVWAPGRRTVEVEFQRSDQRTRRHPLAREENGFFTATVPGVGHGDCYQYWLDGQVRRPDPISRFQPTGPHGWSQIVDPSAFVWHDQAWSGIPKSELVIYELHLGTFTPEGTYRAASGRLDELVELGVTAVELMPVAQSPGRWNWGYDGVNLFAPRNTYGTPDELRAFVDACHAKQIAVLLDVVYNHLGPEGNYLGDFGPYFSRAHGTPWGPALNFDGRHSRPVRQLVLHNVLYWLHEFHIDGLRLDAVHFMYDNSPFHIVDEIAQWVERARPILGRTVHLVGETNVFDAARLAPHPTSRASFDAIWCDDFLHAVQSVAMHGRRLTNRVYYGADDLASVLQHGYLYQSPSYERVTHDLDHPTCPAESLVFSLQNHDVIGNHPDGDRLHHLATPEFQRAAAAVMLLYPAIPMLFMGEEFSAEAKFLFFVDFGDESLRQAVVRGRAAEHPQHAWDQSVSPISEQAFVLSRPGPRSAGNQETWKWYQALLAIRRQWRHSGLLTPENLHVRYDANSQVIALRYEQSAQSAFLVARLHDRQQTPVPVELRVTGSIRLTSEVIVPDSDTAERIVRPRDLNWALVGMGKVDW